MVPPVVSTMGFGVILDLLFGPSFWTLGALARSGAVASIGIDRPTAAVPTLRRAALVAVIWALANCPGVAERIVPAIAAAGYGRRSGLCLLLHGFLVRLIHLATDVLHDIVKRAVVSGRLLVWLGLHDLLSLGRHATLATTNRKVFLVLMKKALM